MNQANQDDDIYSLENLQPAPPKPPKPSITKKSKRLTKNSTSATVLPTQGSNIFSPLTLERSLSVQDEVSVTIAPGSKVSRHKSAACRLQSNPVTSSETRLATLLERDSFCRSGLALSSPSSGGMDTIGLVSATSSSLFHGVILILIMLTSLAAFVASKLKDPCEDFYVSDAYECSQLTSVTFSVINILSCLYSFTVYFLHLIGQCDYITWSARRKVSLEIFFTLIMCASLTGSIIALITQTTASSNIVSLVAVIFSVISVLLYGIRSALLFREIRMLWSRPTPVSSVRQTSTYSRKTSVSLDSRHGSTSDGKSGLRGWPQKSSVSRTISSSSQNHHGSGIGNSSIKVKPQPASRFVTVVPNQRDASEVNHDTVSGELEDDVFIS